MNIPTNTDVAAKSMTISWTELTDSRNGGDIPIFYQLEYSTDNITFTGVISGDTKVLTFTHVVATPFPSGGTVYYRVKAQNNVGFGTPSKVLAVTCKKIPQGMTALSMVSVNPFDITISWPELTNQTINGGDPPIFYSVEWSPDNTTWTVLNAGGNLILEYTHTVSTMFAAASFQYYRVRAQNNVGIAFVYSTVLKVKCDEAPLGMNAVTAKEVNPSNITISWLELNSTTLNGGDLPIFYSVEFQTSLDANWTVLNTGGSLVLEYQYAPNFVLNENITYQFRVRAENRIGLSNVYSGVLTVQPDTRPTGMNKPSVLSQNTQYNWIKWAELTDTVLNGGDLPNFYSLEYSADQITWSVLNNDGLLVFNLTSWPGTILSKRAYYRVRAQNGVGLSNIYSSTLLVTQVSNHSANPCSVNPSNITICFSETSDQWGNGALPSFYQLEWLNPTTYGTSCDNVPLSFKNDATNPTRKPTSLWKIISPTVGLKNNYLTHSLLPGALPDSTPGIFPNNIFPSGSNQCYRVRMQLNGVFQGTPSTVTSVQADQVPYGMTAPEVTEIHPYNITLEWKELTTPDNGRDMPVFYQLQWYDYTSSAWVDLLNYTVNGKILQYTHVRPVVYQASTTLQYRLIAQNGVGLGTVYSPILFVNPDTEPIGMDPLSTVSVNPYNITISWPELTFALNGGDPPYYYEVDWYNNSASTWIKMINNESAGKFYSYTHIVVGNYFPPGTLEQYRVTPKNLVGWGRVSSPVLSVLTDTFPNTPTAPVTISIEPIKFVIQWNDQASDSENGRDLVTYFQLDWDQGNGTWLTLTSPLSQKLLTYSLIQSSIFVPNSLHQFRIRSQNVIGFSDFSTNLTITADSPPTRMPTPTATLISPKLVSLKWNTIVTQADTGRDPVIYYRLDYLVRPCYSDSNATSCLSESMDLASWVEITVKDVQRANNTFNHIFTTLMKPDETFFYRVCPMNSVGFGVCSDSFAMLSDTTPKFMNPPVVISSQVFPNWIVVSWTGIFTDLETGRDPIVYYDLQYDQGNSTWVSLMSEAAGLVYNFNHTLNGLFPNGRNVNYRLRAKNGVGFGVYSTVTTVLCDSTPPSMNPPYINIAANQINPRWIYLTWNPMTDCSQTGRDCPVGYGLEQDQGNDTWANLTTINTGLITNFNVTFSEAYPSGQVFKFKTYAKNGVGYGAYSSILSVTGDTVPTFMFVPQIQEVNPTNISLNWQEITTTLQTGGDAPIFYDLQWDQGDENSWISVFNETIVLVTNFVANSLDGKPFPSGGIIQFRLRAKNGIGFGAYSDILSVECDKVPQVMFPPYINSQFQDVNPYWIMIYWDEVQKAPSNGGDNIIFYGLEWDQGNDTWANLTTPEMGLATFFNVSSLEYKPFPSGITLKFRCYAKNGVGYGAYSADFSVITDQVPQYMDLPWIDLSQNNVNPLWIYLQWNPILAQELTGGDDIIYYELQWDQGLYSPLTPEENWKTITEPDLGLVYASNLTVTEHFPSNSTQIFRLRGHNKVGAGVWSQIFSMQTDKLPLFMNPPLVDYSANHINPTWIFVTWDGITGDEQTGGDNAISYGLEWDQGNDTWVNVSNSDLGLVQSFNLTTQQFIASGLNLNFRTYAKNGVGYGAYSSIFTVVSDKIPQFMNVPVIIDDNINPNWIYMTWDGISGNMQTGGDNAIFYGAEWDQGNGTWVSITNESIGMVYSFNFTSPNNPFPNGINLSFRLYAKNGVGNGLYSATTVIMSDSVPMYMNQPQVVGDGIHPNWINVNWSGISTLADTGRDPVVFYGLEWDQANGTWVNLTTPAMGMVYNYNLSAPTPPFASGCRIQFRAYAKNGVGFGYYSAVTQIQADTIPLFMNIPEVNYLANQINPNWIYVTWTGISDNAETGGDIANHYGIEWDQGNGTWLRLTKGTEGLIYTYNLTSPSAPFTSGMIIQFRALARNGVGYGAYSQILSITADSIPIRMNSPVELQVDYNMIYFNWNPISDWADTGGDDIVYYQVQFNNQACYIDDILPCLNQTDNWTPLTTEPAQGVKTNFKYLSLTHFSRDRQFEYRICAKNGVGMGACSPVTKILTDTIPLQMAAPTVDEVLHDQIHLSWLPVNDFDASGRSPVVRYKVQWDEYQWYYGNDQGELNGTNVTWKDCGTVDHVANATRILFIHENLPNFIQKRKVMYRVQAINNVGEGPFSLQTQTKTVNRFWSKPRSWDSKIVPIEGQSVIIPYGQNFTFDLVESPIYNRIDVNGQLEFHEEMPNLHLKAYSIFIKSGDMWIGASRAQPFQGQAKISLYGTQQSANLSVDQNTFGGNKALINIGMFQAFGLPRIRMTRLLQTIDPNATTLALPKGLSWRQGDQIGIAPSDMRYIQHDYAVITSYNNDTGETQLDRQLTYYHYGKNQSTASSYSGVDMRTEVYLLTRNIVIQSASVTPTQWGCQILTTSMLDGLLMRKGQTFMDNVQISNCSQYGGLQAALRFEDSQGLEQSITNSAMHHGEGQAMQIQTSKNIRFSNNTVFDFGKYGINVSSSINLTIDSNHICALKDFQIGESASSEIQPAGILGCLMSDCNQLSITNNVVSGVSYAGYIASGHECGDSEKQTIFKNNLAHSINGWGAVMFTNMKSFTQLQFCVEASYFKAYKCSEGGITMYNATLTVTFSNMVLIDNQIGGTIMMVGSAAAENNTQLAIFRDSIFYGETEARDCKVIDACFGAAIDKSECFNRNGLFASYFTTKGKAPLTNSKKDLPLQKIMSDASYGGDSQYRNLTFVGFKEAVTYCGNQQRAVALNPSGADYHPRSKFFNTKFIDQGDDALAYFFTPPADWIDFRLCGIDPCTGPLNTFFSFEDTTYSGTLQPSDTPSKFQITPFNTRVAGKISGCTFVKSWNAYKCQTSTQLAILLFESRDADNKTRVISPISLYSKSLATKADVNTFMSHQEFIVTQIERLSRFPVLVQTDNNMPSYEIEYNSAPPSRQRFTLIADAGSMVSRIHYPKAAAYILRDRAGNQITANTWDDVNRVQRPIKGLYCGENKFDATTNILEFYMSPNCTIWIEAVDVIQTNVRLNWTLNNFYKQGGVTTFKTNLAKSINIQPSFIRVLSVVQGSVIVDFQIYQASDDSNFKAAGGLDTVKAKLFSQIEDQTIWLGAPILNATIVGKAVNVKDKKTQVFENAQDWNATGTEVWVNQPMIVDNPSSSPSELGTQIGSIQEVQGDSSTSGGSSFAIVIGILLGVGVLLCGIVIFVYRRYKRRQEEKQVENSLKLDEHVAGSSPLKNNGNVTSFDEEAAGQDSEQFQPSQMFNSLYEKDFSTVRKANEGDRLMIQSSERKTRDDFFHQQQQPTFGEKHVDDSIDDYDDGVDSQFERVSDFQMDEQEFERSSVIIQREPEVMEINKMDYEAEIGDFEDAFQVKDQQPAAGPVLQQQFNAKIVPEETLGNAPQNGIDIESDFDLEDDEYEEGPDQNQTLYIQHEEVKQELKIEPADNIKIENFDKVTQEHVLDEDDFSSLDMNSDEENERPSQPPESDLVQHQNFLNEQAVEEDPKPPAEEDNDESFGSLGSLDDDDQ